MNEKCILYLRTDLCDQELTAGGSVAHTIGVIKGFQALEYSIICASSCVDSVLDKKQFKFFIKLSNPSFLGFLRWKINSFLSSFIFFFQITNVIKKNQILCIYQRYSMLNLTGILLGWWYGKKLILEYNGSESWTTTHWIQKKKFITGAWLIHKIENLNLQFADYVVVVSEVLKDEIMARGVQLQKILVNPNGVDAHTFNAGHYERGEFYESVAK